MSRLKEALDKGEFVFTTELYPPKGTDTTRFLELARRLKGKVVAMNIPDNQRALVKLSSLAGSLLLLREGIEPIYQLTTRDRSRIAIQSDLLGASALGITNILALTGDHTLLGDTPEAKPVFDLDSVQLLYLISKLNRGIDINDNPLQGKTNFLPGAVANPGMEPLEPELMKFEKKVMQGAKFFQTQIIYDIKRFERFMKFVRRFPVKILAGVILLSSEKMAEFINSRVPGAIIPDSVIKRLNSAEDKIGKGIEIASAQIRRLRDLCDGVHIMTVGKEEYVERIIECSI